MWFSPPRLIGTVAARRLSALWHWLATAAPWSVQPQQSRATKGRQPAGVRSWRSFGVAGAGALRSTAAAGAWAAATSGPTWLCISVWVWARARAFRVCAELCRHSPPPPHSRLLYRKSPLHSLTFPCLPRVRGRGSCISMAVCRRVCILVYVRGMCLPYVRPCSA